MRGENWTFFASTGWLDDDWAWHAPVYDRIASCGEPRGPPVGEPAPFAYRREYAGCTAVLNCTAAGDDGLVADDAPCRAHVEWTR